MGASCKSLGILRETGFIFDISWIDFIQLPLAGGVWVPEGDFTPGTGTPLAALSVGRPVGRPKSWIGGSEDQLIEL
jgi:hypothetical protein